METLHAADQGLLYRFETLHWPWLTAVLQAVTRLGNGEVLGGIAAVIVVAFAVARERRAALCLAGAGLLALLLVKGVQLYVNRPRPDLAWRRLERLPASASFPSGHALGTTAIFVTAALLLARRIRRRRPAYLLVAGTFVLVLTIGFSRTYLGVHYPLDVLGGWLAGLGIALLAFWADGRWEARKAAPDGSEREGDVQLVGPSS